MSIVNYTKLASSVDEMSRVTQSLLLAGIGEKFRRNENAQKITDADPYEKLYPVAAKRGIVKDDNFIVDSDRMRGSHALLSTDFLTRTLYGNPVIANQVNFAPQTVAAFDKSTVLAAAGRRYIMVPKKGLPEVAAHEIGHAGTPTSTISKAIQTHSSTPAWAEVALGMSIPALISAGAQSESDRAKANTYGLAAALMARRSIGQLAEEHRAWHEGEKILDEAGVEYSKWTKPMALGTYWASNIPELAATGYLAHQAYKAHQRDKHPIEAKLGLL